MSSRVANTTRVYVFGVVNKVIQILCPFAIRTIIIYKLGAEYLGLSSLFTSILSVLSFSELGIGSAITFCLYKPVADNDIDTINALMALMKKLYRWIGIFIVMAGLMIMPFSRHFIKGSYPEDINIYILYCIYLANSAVTYFGFAYRRTLLDVYQEGYVSFRIETIVDVVKYAVQIAVLLFFANYYIYAAMLPVASIAITAAIYFCSRKRHPQITPKGKAAKEQIDIIKNKVLFLSLHSVAARITNSVDNIVISGFLGLTSIAVYGNYQYIHSSVFAFITLAYDALRPAVANHFYSSSTNKEDPFFLYRSLKLLSNWASIWTTTCLLCLYQPFITLWVGESYLLDLPSLIMIVLYFYSNVIRQFYSGIYVIIAGLWNKTLPRQIIAAGMNLVLDLLLARRYGVAGIIFASFFTNAFVALPMDVYVVYKHVFMLKPIAGILELLKGFGLLCAISGATYWICSFVPYSGVSGLLCKALTCVLLPNAILLALLYRTRRFSYLKDHLVGMFKKT